MEFGATVGGVTSDLVMMALNAASLRHAAIAANIANANTEGYQPLAVSFDEQVGLYREQLLNPADNGSAHRALESLRSSMRYAPMAAESTAHKVQLDEEIAKLMRNTVNYEALIAAQSKLTSITRMAVTEGR